MIAARALSYALLLALVASAATAQKPDPRTAGASIQGKIRPITQNSLLLSAEHAPQRETASRNLLELLDIVQRNPAFSPPMGLDIEPSLMARSPLFGVNRSAIQYELTELFYWYTIPDGDRIRPQWASMVAFYLHANNISLAWDAHERWIDDPSRQTYWEPRQVGEVAGSPYYETGALVLKKHDRPIWIPLTREQVLTTLVANAQKAVAEVPSYAAPESRAMLVKQLTCLESALARLTPSERSSPAYALVAPPPPECSPLVDATAPYARRLVTENPDYYDRALPPAAIQVMVLEFASLRHVSHPWQRAVVERLCNEMDYRALAAMM